MDGLISGTIFVTIALLYIKIRERIEASRTRRHEEWIDSLVPRYGPTYHEGRATVRKRRQIDPRVTMKEAQEALTELGRVMNTPAIDISLKYGPKPTFLTDQEWMDSTIAQSLADAKSGDHVDEDWFIRTEEEFDEAWNRACLKEQQYLDQIRIARNRKRRITSDHQTRIDKHRLRQIALHTLNPRNND